MFTSPHNALKAVEETPFVPPPGVTDMKTIALTWLLNFLQKQGAAMLVTLGFTVFFAFRMNRLEERLDDCQSSREDARIERVVSSNQAVINALETLIGKLEYSIPNQPSPLIKTRFKK